MQFMINILVTRWKKCWNCQFSIEIDLIGCLQKSGKAILIKEEIAVKLVKIGADKSNKKKQRILKEVCF